MSVVSDDATPHPALRYAQGHPLPAARGEGQQSPKLPFAPRQRGEGARRADEGRVVSSSDIAGVIEDILRRGATARMRVTGISMAPAIVEGDFLHVEPVSPDVIRRGDVVLTLMERGLTAHRVTAISRKNGLRMRLRGDNSLISDGWIDATAMLGRVSSIERNGRSSPAYRKYKVIAGTLRPLIRRSGNFIRRVMWTRK